MAETPHDSWRPPLRSPRPADLHPAVETIGTLAEFERVLDEARASGTPLVLSTRDRQRLWGRLRVRARATMVEEIGPLNSAMSRWSTHAALAVILLTLIVVAVDAIDLSDGRWLHVALLVIGARVLGGHERWFHSQYHRRLRRALSATIPPCPHGTEEPRA